MFGDNFNPTRRTVQNPRDRQKGCTHRHLTKRYLIQLKFKTRSNKSIGRVLMYKKYIF